MEIDEPRRLGSGMQDLDDAEPEEILVDEVSGLKPGDQHISHRGRKETNYVSFDLLTTGNLTVNEFCDMSILNLRLDLCRSVRIAAAKNFDPDSCRSCRK